MKSQTKKILKLSGIILGALTAVAGILIAVVLNFIFTSEKLTPIVLEAANRNLNAKLDMKSVELTFFSTFPRFGVQLTDGTLVSKAIRDTLWQRTDTLVSFKKAVAVVNPMDYLRQQKISIHRLALEHADIYAYKNKDGIANWDITVPDTVQSASSPAGDAMNISELDIRQISIQHATVTMDDRDTRIFANLWDTDLTLKANMKKGHSMLAVDFRNKNLLFWQDGQLLANRIATHLRTDLELNTARHSLLLHDAMIDINGTKLGVKGTVRRDTAAKALDVDLQYGLHTPSLETVLHMIPESILKKGGSIGRRRSKFHRHAERHVRQAEDAPCHAGHQDKRCFRQIRRAALRHRQGKRRLFRPDRPHAEHPLLPEPENLPVQRRRHRHIGRYESGQPAHRPGHHLSYPLHRRPEYAGADFPSSGSASAWMER